MKQASIITLVAFLASLCGGITGRFLYTAELAKCHRSFHACDLNAEGQQMMLDGCDEDYERAELAELGMKACDAAVNEGEQNLKDANARTEMMETVAKAWELQYRKCKKRRGGTTHP